MEGGWGHRALADPHNLPFGVHGYATVVYNPVPLRLGPALHHHPVGSRRASTPQLAGGGDVLAEGQG